MKYVKLFEEFDFIEDWEEESKDEIDYDRMINTTESQIRRHGTFHIKVMKKDWPIILKFLEEHSIFWRGRRKPEIDDVNLHKYAELDYIVLYIRKDDNKYRMTHGYTDEIEEEEDGGIMYEFTKDKITGQFYPRLLYQP